MKYTWIIALLAVVMLLAACGGEPGDKDGEENAPAQAPAPVAALTVPHIERADDPILFETCVEKLVSAAGDENGDSVLRRGHRSPLSASSGATASATSLCARSTHVPTSIPLRST